MDVLDQAFGPAGATLRETIAGLAPERREEFGFLQARCIRCHTLNSVFAAHLRPGTWEEQVRRMARKSGAAIPAAEGVRIAAFMEFLSERRRTGTP